MARIDVRSSVREPTTKEYSLLPSWGFVPAAQDMAFVRLAGAIIGQAARDARYDDVTEAEARRAAAIHLLRAVVIYGGD